MAMPSVYETPRLCIRCGTEYIPRRPGADRIGTFSEYCSTTCQKSAAQKSSVDAATSRSKDRSTRLLLMPSDFAAPRQRRVGGGMGNRTEGPRHGRVRETSVLSPFACRLASLRISRSWTRSDLAKQIGASENTVMNWELDKTDISAKWVLKLARFFGTSMGELFGEQEATG